MALTQMTPTEIYTIFITRINKTNQLFDMLTDDSSLDLFTTIYFKYYFDISVTIEAIIRGITFVEAEKSKYVEYLAEPGSVSVAYFKDYEEIKALCGLDNLFDKIDKDTFKNDFFEKVSALKGKKINMTFKNDGKFIEIYGLVRKTRNTLAHGLVASGVDYNTDTLEYFIYVMYILYNYYKNIA